MKRINQAAIAILTLAATAGTAFARYNTDSSYVDYARVLSVDRVITGESSQPVTRQDCWNEPVDEYHPGTTMQRKLPPIVDGDTVTTRTVETQQEGYYTRDYQERCRSRTDYRSQPTVAYDVVYRYHGQDYHDRIGHDPGGNVRVRVDNGYVEIAE